MLLVLLPLTDVNPAIWPVERALALLQVIPILPYVLTSVRPGVFTPTFHLVIFPVALICVSVCPGVNAITADVVLLEFSGERRAIRP